MIHQCSAGLPLQHQVLIHWYSNRTQRRNSIFFKKILQGREDVLERKNVDVRCMYPVQFPPVFHFPVTSNACHCYCFACNATGIQRLISAPTAGDPRVDSLVWLDQGKWGQSLLAVVQQRWAGLPLQHQVLIHWYDWTKGSFRQSLLAVVHQRWAGLPLQHQVLIHWSDWTKGSGERTPCLPLPRRTLTSGPQRWWRWVAEAVA